MQWNRYVTFLCGQPGIYALGAAAAKCKGDQQRLDRYLGLFNAVPIYWHKILYRQNFPEIFTVVCLCRYRVFSNTFGHGHSDRSYYDVPLGVSLAVDRADVDKFSVCSFPSMSWNLYMQRLI